MKVFIDTNVIIDFLADRKPFSEEASSLFQLAENKVIESWVAAISFNNTYYTLRQVTSHDRAIRLINELEEIVEIQETNRTILKKSINSDFKDFEDAIQYYSAVEIGGIEMILTRNSKDFKNSQIPVLSPESGLKLIMQMKS